MPRAHLLELDRLVRQARASVVSPAAESGDIELLEAVFAFTALQDLYDRLCDEAGLDSASAEAFETLRALGNGLTSRVADPNVPEPEFARYATLVMARAAAEDAELRLQHLGALAQQTLGVNPFAEGNS